MLWVNGYSGSIAQFLKMVPKAGKPYWEKSVIAAGQILKDWNWMFIDPDTHLFSTAKANFKSGYDFAQENERTIQNNILISGNMLQIVAHGKGIAFAEGIAAWFYEEKGIVTDLAIYLDGTYLSATPQTRRAIDCRIEYTTTSNKSKKRRPSLKFKDATVIESDLNNGFFRYAITLASRESDHKTDNLYFKNMAQPKVHFSQSSNSQFALWSAIDHAIKMYVDSEILYFSGKVENIKYVAFEKFSMN